MAALGFAVLGVGLAIAGCFFPPLELAAGASFEAALAASAGTAFVLADAAMAIGVGIDVSVALAHPTPANKAVVVGDALGLAIGYGIGKAIGVAVSKFGPTVAEMFAQRAAERAAQEALQEADPATVYHFKGTKFVQFVLDGINPEYFGKDTRYGAGFYVAQQGETAIAEVSYHGVNAAEGQVIRYEMDMSKVKALDMTDPATAKAYHVEEAFAHERAVEADVLAKRAEGILPKEALDELTSTKYAKFQEIGARAQAEGYNAVKFPSVRGKGSNYVIYSKSKEFINQVMKPQMVMPATK